MTSTQDIQNSEGLHVLIIPAWMPSEQDPASGTFIIEQAIALTKHPGLRIGMIFQDSTGVPPEVTRRLDQYHVHHIFRRHGFLPKVHGFLIGLWNKKYEVLFQEYCNQHGTPQLIHAHSYVAAFAAAFISEKTGIPFVLTEHSTNFLSRRVRHYHATAIRNAYRRARCIVAVGKSLKEALTAWTKTEVIQLPNIVDASIFNYDPSVTKLAQFTVVYIGALIPHKRPELIIKALASCNDVNLIIIGSGPQKDALNKLARSCRTANRIEWIPYLSPLEIAQKLKQAHMLVSVSEYETFGIVVAEALMCGLPVVCTASGGPEEFVGTNSGIVLPVNASASEIAGAILRIKENEMLYSGEEISTQARARFEQEKGVPALVKLYQTIIETR